MRSLLLGVLLLLPGFARAEQDLSLDSLYKKDLVVVGHANPSTAFDDDTRHPTNPLLPEQVGSYCARKPRRP